MEEQLPRSKCLPRRSRLIKSAAFGAVLSSHGPDSVRKSSKWLSLTAQLKPGSNGNPCLRFGFTVGKANAHRGVDRVLVKRILREAARNARPTLLEAGISADVVLRLKRRFPKRDEGESIRGLKEEIRLDCDALLQRFCSSAGRSGQEAL